MTTLADADRRVHAGWSETGAPSRAEPATVVFTHRGHDWIRGSERCLLDLLAGLDRTAFRPVLICDTPTLAGEAAALGVPVSRIVDWGNGRPVAEPAVRRRVLGLLREHGADLVHANMTATIPALLPAVRRLRLPLVAHMHLPIPDRTQRLFECVHQASVVVGVAESVVAPFPLDGMSRDRLRVTANGVDDGRLNAGDARGLRASLGIPARAIVAVAVGSLIARKGHDVTIAGVAAARARGAELRLLVCGDGEEDGALRALAARLGVADVVHFLGFRADVGAVLRDAADLCVSSALEEALPLNALEAQWLGVPVVASDIAGHREALVDGETGMLVAPGDPDALARALVALADDAPRRAALGARARAHARERFAMSRYVADFEALYRSLLARPRGAYGWLRGSSWPHAYTAWLGRVAARRMGLRRAARSGAP